MTGVALCTNHRGGWLAEKMPLILGFEAVVIVQFCWLYLCNFVFIAPSQLSSNYLLNYFSIFWSLQCTVLLLLVLPPPPPPLIFLEL